MNEKKFKNKNRKNKCKRCNHKYVCDLHNAKCNKIIICRDCEIQKTCTYLCPMLNGYLKRGSFYLTPQIDKVQPLSRTPEDIIEKATIDIENEEAIPIVKNGVVYLNFPKELKSRLKIKIDDIPWHTVSELTEKRIKRHFLEGLSYNQIAELEGRPPHTGRIYRSVKKALKKLFKKYEEKEFFLKNKDIMPTTFKIYLEDYFENNMRIAEIAEKYGKSTWVVYKALKYLKERMK